jgi:hypothetical protein
LAVGGDGGLGAVGGSGRRSTVEDGIRLQQYYEDLLLAPKYWKVAKADEEEFEDAIIKFKTDKKGDLLVMVKYSDRSSNGWYEGSVNTAGLVQFDNRADAPWTGNVNSDGGHLGFHVSYGDGNVGLVIAGGVWSCAQGQDGSSSHAPFRELRRIVG